MLRCLTILDVQRIQLSVFVPELCDAIVAEYGPEVVNFPTTPEEWRVISMGTPKGGNFITAWELWMGSTYECKLLQSPVPCTVTTRVSSPSSFLR